MKLFRLELPIEIPAYGEVNVYGVKSILKRHRISQVIKHELGFTVTFLDSETDGVTFVARRLNLVNVGTDARLVLMGDAGDVHKFVAELSDVDDDTPGDKLVDLTSIILCDGADADYRISPSSLPDVQSSFTMEILKSQSCRWESLGCCEGVSQAEDSDDIETEQIDDERQEALDDLRDRILAYVAKYHSDPTPMLKELIKGKIVLNPQGFSRVVVNDNTQIVLADYDETEVKMGARERTLYIFFLMHHDGMRQVEIADHREELYRIYSIVKPGASDRTARNAVDNLCDPLYGTLSESISRIKKAVKHAIRDEEVARRYYIDGERGGVYRIDVSPQMVTLPRALTD